MKQLLFIHCLCAFLLSAYHTAGQSIKKGRDKVNGTTFFYHFMEPPQAVKGILVLLPGAGEKTKSIFYKTKLPEVITQQGYVTIVPEIPFTLYANDVAIQILNRIFTSQSQKYKAQNAPFFLGGLSSGGAISLGYAAHLAATNANITLQGVFAIDPPLDLQRIYASSERKIQYQCGDLITREGHNVKNYLNNVFGGAPEAHQEQYVKNAVFTSTVADGGNAKYLQYIPIRLYSEPDLAFVNNTYCDKLVYEDINAVDLEKLHQFLVNKGNKNVAYITTKGKGFHSWNIVDAPDCVAWIVRLANRE